MLMTALLVVTVTWVIANSWRLVWARNHGYYGYTYIPVRSKGNFMSYIHLCIYVIFNEFWNNEKCSRNNHIPLISFPLDSDTSRLDEYPEITLILTTDGLHLYHEKLNERKVIKLSVWWIKTMQQRKQKHRMKMDYTLPPAGSCKKEQWICTTSIRKYVVKWRLLYFLKETNFSVSVVISPL